MERIKQLGGAALAVAAAFAVAVAVLVSSPATAEAATVTLANDDNSATAAPGDTVNIGVESPFATVTITGTGDGVSGSFVFNGGQSIQCADSASASSCDVDDSDAGTAGRQNIANQTSVALKVASDSGEGFILLTVGGLGEQPVAKVITVSKETLVGSLSIKASAATISAATGMSTLTVEVKNASSPAAGLNGRQVSLVTTLGSIECTAGTETQACSATTANYDHDGDNTNDDVPGGALVTLNGKGVEGQAVVTARLGTLTASVTVTMYGTAKNLTAEPRQNSIEIGGKVYVVLTVTDGAGHPVSGQVISPVTSKEVVGPSGVDKPVLVATEKNTPAVAGTSAVGVGYSKDYIDAKNSKNSIPACGDDNTGSADGTTNDAFAPGTNSKGQCVVHVTAPDDSDNTKDATRGVHTLNFAIGQIKASAMIEVAGSPASIRTDAPSMVDPGSVTAITVSVYDDTDVLVGITSVKVRKVDGGGLIEDQGDNGSENTVNGQSKFTFIAPTAPGTAEILITAGTVNQRLSLTIGDPAAAPAPPESVSVSAQSGLVVIQNAGSIGDILGALACGNDAGTTVTLAGNNIYVVGAPAVVNSGFTRNVQFPVEIAAGYVSCG